jgi:hypothetical protein
VIVQRPPARHASTAMKVVLLSGLSDPRTCALTESQTEFLRWLPVDEEAKVYRNFPYVLCTEPRKQPPLWLASWRNTWQFLRASSGSYRDAARGHWRALADSAESLVVITLSCGLEIINQCLDDDDARRPIQILAVGPVAWHKPEVPCTLIQAKDDYISKCFFRRPDVVVSPGGHMNYLAKPDVLQCINDYLCSNTSRLRAAASISLSAG